MLFREHYRITVGFLWLRSFKYLCLYIIVTRNLQLAAFFIEFAAFF